MRQVWDKIRIPLVLIILLGVLFWGAWWGYKNVIKPIDPLPAPPCVTQTVGEVLTPDKVSLRVFNGGKTRGLATRTSVTLEDHGFKVVKVDNAERQIQKTEVIGGTAESPQVLLVAGFFVEPTVVGDGRQDGTVDVILGSEFAGMTPEPVTQVPLPDGTACLPGSPSASPTDSPTENQTENAPAQAEPTS